MKSIITHEPYSCCDALMHTIIILSCVLGAMLFLAIIWETIRQNIKRDLNFEEMKKIVIKLGQETDLDKRGKLLKSLIECFERYQTEQQSNHETKHHPTQSSNS